VGLSASRLSRYLMLLAEHSRDAESAIFNATNADTAYNELCRRVNRVIDAGVEEILRPNDATTDPGAFDEPELDSPFPPVDPDTGEAVLPANVLLFPPRARPTIIAEDFLHWAESYDGPRFNLIHVDFPYGVNVGSGGQVSPNNVELDAVLYDDDESIYWELLAGFIQHRERFIASSAHILFWFSMKHYSRTIHEFRKCPDLAVNPIPLVWHKSDNAGILPDASRGPRQIYETALLISRGDRKIVKAKSNCFSFPRGEPFHISEKPIPVCRYFLDMLIDSTTTFFDPTCGGASALIAAKEAGVGTILGLELDPTMAEKASARFRSAL